MASGDGYLPRVVDHADVGESHYTGVCVDCDDAGPEEEGGGRARTISSHQDLVPSYLQLHQTVFFSWKYP